VLRAVVNEQCTFNELAIVKTREDAFASKIEVLSLKTLAVYDALSVKFIWPSAPAPQIEKINNCKDEQRDQKPLPFDVAWSPKLSIEVSVN
jgi:hypothetical protein